jgi:hypothetical protein
MSEFSSLKIVGGLLSSDVLGRIFAGDSQVPGTSPESYGLERGESVRRQASRSWPYLLETWQDEKKRDRWTRILLRELGFPHEIPSHIAFRALGWDVDLDHRTPHREARAPQSVMQESLNRDDSRLWGILCNGVTLRLLRDSATLVGSSYVEFDLKAIFDGELFSDFVLLYLACHESRFAVQGDGGPESCYLEQWRAFAAAQGERALDQLRDGVTRAIAILGTGFISHPGNPQLRLRLANDELRLDDLNRALLRLVYRILFWFVAEDRDALLVPDVSAETSHAIASSVSAETRARLREARDRYHQYFSADRLRRLARHQRGNRHTDLFEAVQLVFDGLSSEGGVPELALPGIGGIFESRREDGTALALDEPLAGVRLSNEALLGAVRSLSLVKSREAGALRRVDFGNLGAEELGSIYESLLELIPHYDPDNRSYTLTVLPGNERKESGSYYTPTSLVECLLDSALDPLLDEAAARGTAEEKVAALLDLTVCDPACGSGHFLVAAARRIAKRIAAEETDESEPPEPEIRKALRRVVGRCIYGVDVNPMAAELAKVSLWLEALEPGKPLSYLDQNIRVGNSLLGVTPALLADGLPDAAFTPIEGDDRKVCASLKKQNAAERQGQHDLFSQSGISVSNVVLAKRSAEITHTLPESLEDLHIHQQRQAEQLAASSERRIQKLLADAWCAAFVQRKTDVTRSIAITHAVLENFGADDNSLNLAAAERLVTELTRQYRFFHWHVEFPHIFRVGNGTHDLDPATGWSGGFSCVIGNPPWEKVELKEQEFFAQRDPKIANASTAAIRKKMIAALPDVDPALYAEFTSEQRKSSGWTHLLKETGRYPLTGQGRLNTYAVFAETARMVIDPQGRGGLVLPTGIATDATTAPFFGDLVRNAKLVSFLDFENEAFLLSRAVHHSVRFCLLTVCGRATRVNLATFAFGTRYMRDFPDRRFTMPPEEILLVNPNTGTTPVFRSRRDAEITIGIYKRVPVLWRDSPEENPWGISLMQGIFNSASDSGLFLSRSEDGLLPLHEAKMFHHFDHRFGTYTGYEQAQVGTNTLPRPTLTQKRDPEFTVLPRYWVQKAEVERRLARNHWHKDWLLGWRDICRSTDERTMICSILPRTAVPDGTLLMFPTQGSADMLLVVLSSFVLDYVARQKISGTHLKFFTVKQLPVLPPLTLGPSTDFVRRRVLELIYTAWDIRPFARELGDEGSPFVWDEERRFVMRAELNAALFHLYAIERDNVDYIMETFSVVKKRDVQQYGTFRTKDLILQLYDTMAEAIRSERPYRTILDPPPGHGLRHLAH